MSRVEFVDDLRDEAGVDTGIITERDIRVDPNNFNPVDNSRITRESSTSSHATEEDSPCP